ncbi:MAG: hypothetical protein JWO13_1331 [Acidobacteriales bacterium]|nr:hypothetical protein [Terriglobales bacterium]
MRVEHTEDKTSLPPDGFEDREDHRIPFASAMIQSNKAVGVFW